MKQLIRIFLILQAMTISQLATSQDAPAFVGPGPSSEELSAMSQLAGARGLQERHYYFADAGREMGFQLYVPESYDPQSETPMVVALHGFGVNYRFFFSFVSELPALCEEYGYICVAPMGYSTSGWYGAPMTVPGAPPPGSNLPIPQEGDADEQARERALSEQDVMNVIKLVRSEYKVDAERTYLMGHSMGGFGTWHLGEKYLDMWAAIAPMSGINSNGFAEIDFRKLAAVPVLVAVGEEEAPTVIESKKAVEALKEAGGEAVYLEIEGGTHGSMVAPSTAEIFRFFSAH